MNATDAAAVGDNELSTLGPVDIAVLIVYYLVVSGIFAYVSLRGGSSNKDSSTAGYFLADRSVSYWAVAFSLFASNIGSEHFVGLAGGAAATGVAMGFYEVGAIPALLLLGLFFLPTYLNAGVQTTPDYLERRYSLRCRTLMVCVSLAVYVLSRISATLFAGQLVLVELIQVDKVLAVVLLVSFTTLYTVVGGLEAVIYTEVLQTVVLVVGGFMMLFFALGEVGGWSELTAQLRAMEELDDDFLDFFHPSSDPQVPWTGFMFGFYVFAPWYFGVDQVIVQRTLAARNVAHGQLGCVLASMLKFIPFFIMVVPGLCARVLVHRELGDADATDFNFDKAYPWLVLNVVPRNARGLIVASMLSALMSALASVFNSSGTLFALNIWKQLRPDATEAQLVRVGRLTVVVLALLALAWLPVMPMLGDSLFTIINKPPAYLAPPILCLYVWGMVSRTPTRWAGEMTLYAGLGVGALRLLLEVAEDVADARVFGAFTRSNFMHFAAVSFWASTALLFLLSLLRPLSHTAALASAEELQRSRDKDADSLFFRTDLFETLMAREHSHDGANADDRPRALHMRQLNKRAASYGSSGGNGGGNSAGSGGGSRGGGASAAATGSAPAAARAAAGADSSSESPGESRIILDNDSDDEALHFNGFPAADSAADSDAQQTAVHGAENAHGASRVSVASAGSADDGATLPPARKFDTELEFEDEHHSRFVRCLLQKRSILVLAAAVVVAWLIQVISLA